MTTKKQNRDFDVRAVAIRDQIRTVRFSRSEVSRLERERKRLKFASLADMIRHCVAEHFAAAVLAVVMATGPVGCETHGDGWYMTDHETNRYLDPYRLVPDRVRVDSLSHEARKDHR